MEYSNDEYCDMIFILGQYNNQANAARRYAKIYPHRRHLDRNVIGRAEIRFPETGTVTVYRR